MKKLIFIILLFTASINAQKACPDCYSYGSVATGGRGKTLGIVTTLDEETATTYHPVSCNVSGHSHALPLSNSDDFYTGGFNNLLLEVDVGYVTFNNSGNIYLASGTGNGSGYRVTYAYGGMPEIRDKTVFGQSAPQGGITFTNGSLVFSNSRNVIMMHLRSRPIYNKNHVIDTSDDANTWGFMFKGADSLYLKNLTASYSQDKNLGGAIDEFDAADGEWLRNITQDMCLVYDGHTNSYWAINPGRPNDPEGRTYNIASIRNGNYAANRTPNMAFDGRGDIINTMNVDAPAYFSYLTHDLQLNYVNNYLTSFSASYGLNNIKAGFVQSIYTSGNVGFFTNTTVGNLGVNDNQQNFFVEEPNWVFPAPSQYFTGTRHSAAPNPYPEVSASAAFEDLIGGKKIGANLYMSEDGYLTKEHDSRDNAMLDNMYANVNYDEKNPANWTLPAITSMTHDSTYDTDWDSLPDDWEVRHFGNITSNSYNDDPDGDGYRNIEEAMYGTDPNELVGNPSYGYTVTPTLGLITTESGGTDAFSVQLNEAPASNVVFDIVSNNEVEGLVDKSTLTFTTGNWSTPQTVTVTGVDDALDDGNILYTITVSVNGASSDNNYDGLADTNVTVTNYDNDAPTPTGKRISKSASQFLINN